MYSVNTLCNFKYALNRILRKKDHEFHITKSPSFKPMMDAFNDACKELKENGKGYINSAEEITEEGKLHIDKSTIKFLYTINQEHVK